MFGGEFLMNAVISPVICEIGPGVWDLNFSLNLREAGAVSDPTSTGRLDLVDTSTASTITLLQISNKQVGQSFTKEFRMTVTADNVYSLSFIAVAGLGTGLNLARLTLIASRLF
jgi:hypothetical protein